MRITAAFTALTIAQCVIGCGQLASQDEADCEDGKCDSQSEFARSVVRSQMPLALTNTLQERVTLPIWGSAFTTDEVVKVRVALEPTGTAGLVFALPGEPEERRAFTLRWSGSAWKLGERVGEGTITREIEVSRTRSAKLVIEIRDGGKTIRVTAGSTRKTLTSRSSVTGPMGIYVELEPGAQLAVRDLAVTQPLSPSLLGTPLQALARAHGRELGSTSETGEWPPRHDLAFESMYAREFDTAGILDFYWTTTRGEDDDFYFVPADLMVNYATMHGQTINGYFLVWDEELPEWVGELAETGGAAGLGGMLDKHIETIVGRYRGRVSSWIVANEAFLGPEDTGTGSAEYASSVWYETLGAGFIERAFRTADRIDPGATLLYNETGAEAENPKSDFMYARMSELVMRGVPIDAVGFQFHVDAAKPPDMASVKRNLQRFAALGLDVFITELDVNLASYPGTHAQRLAKQAELFGAVIDACLAVPACKSITTFGFSDKHGWDELGPAVCKPEGTMQLCAEPLLFTRDYQPKPAYHTIRRSLGG